MNIYAVSWTMSSYLDFHVKALLAQNPELRILGFIFPEIRVPTLEGVPIYDFSNMPVSPDSVYVDFSFAQVLSEQAKQWSQENAIPILSLSAWLNSIAVRSERVEPPVRLDGIPLNFIRDVSIPLNLIEQVNAPSRQVLHEILNAYNTLDFRAIHAKVEAVTIEGYVQSVIQDFNKCMRGGCIEVYSLGFDEIAVQLSKVHFSFREMQHLRIHGDDNFIYELAGRQKNAERVSVHFAKSSYLIAAEPNFEKEAYLLIQLERGLIDAENILRWLQALGGSLQSMTFAQLSSRLSDAFIVCHIQF